MNSSFAQLAEARLYAIIDLGYIAAEQAPRVLEQLVEGGVDLIQLRGKSQTVDELTTISRRLLPLSEAADTPLIVNDHAEIAQQVKVQGVHLGQDDEPISDGRGRVSRPLIIGKSTHSVAQAIAAEQERADYIGFGPLFATPTKPDYAPIGLRDIREVHQKVSVPIFCIGGINIDNLQQVIEAGAKRVVMVSALLRAHSIVDYARCATDMLA